MAYYNVTTVSGDWKMMEIQWIIEPNPQAEEMEILLAGTGGFVDYITVDTLCTAIIPAPAALLLGGIGIGLVGWLRRKSLLN